MHPIQCFHFSFSFDVLFCSPFLVSHWFSACSTYKYSASTILHSHKFLYYSAILLSGCKLEIHISLFHVWVMGMLETLFLYMFMFSYTYFFYCYATKNAASQKLVLKHKPESFLLCYRYVHCLWLFFYWSNLLCGNKRKRYAGTNVWKKIIQKSDRRKSFLYCRLDDINLAFFFQSSNQVAIMLYWCCKKEDGASKISNFIILPSLPVPHFLPFNFSFVQFHFFR